MQFKWQVKESITLKGPKTATNDFNNRRAEYVAIWVIPCGIYYTYYTYGLLKDISSFREETIILIRDSLMMDYFPSASFLKLLLGLLNVLLLAAPYSVVIQQVCKYCAQKRYNQQQIGLSDQDFNITRPGETCIQSIIVLCY